MCGQQETKRTFQLGKTNTNKTGKRRETRELRACLCVNEGSRLTGAERSMTQLTWTARHFRGR